MGGFWIYGVVPCGMILWWFCYGVSFALLRGLVVLLRVFVVFLRGLRGFPTGLRGFLPVLVFPKGGQSGKGEG